MRVLLCLHHRLGTDSGAPGATLSLGAALVALGFGVDYFSFDDAYVGISTELASHQLRFPWKVAEALARHGAQFDLIDASTGDAWLWATVCPPSLRRTALVTRAHGLEHVAQEGERRTAREEGRSMSWKYPVYHGGLRLWEVRRSLRAADHSVMLNSTDRDYARDRLGVPAERLTVMPNGIRDYFVRVPDVVAPAGGPLRMCFIGGWLPLKGIQTLADALGRLERSRVDYELTLLGTRMRDPVFDALPAAVHPRLKVIEHYENRELPTLLSGAEVLLSPSHSEGSSVALLEGMACGLAPIATRVGAAGDLIEPGANGMLVNPRDPEAIVDAITTLAADRDRLLTLRRAAQATARAHGWRDIAAHTGALYEDVLSRRSANEPRGRPRSA